MINKFISILFKDIVLIVVCQIVTYAYYVGLFGVSFHKIAWKNIFEQNVRMIPMCA